MTEFRKRMTELLRGAANGETIVIERRGQPVAELRPLSTEGKQPPLPDMTDIWANLPQVPGDRQIPRGRPLNTSESAGAFLRRPYPATGASFAILPCDLQPCRRAWSADM
jgi:antitoxin (DNA-binding transcriptional repressor) of toxin-antitoxin stability system